MKFAQIAIIASDRRLNISAEYARVSEPDAEATVTAPYIPKDMGRISSSIPFQRNLLRIKNRAKKRAVDTMKIGRDTEFVKLGTISKEMREKNDDSERAKSQALIIERASSGSALFKVLYSFSIRSFIIFSLRYAFLYILSQTARKVKFFIDF